MVCVKLIMHGGYGTKLFDVIKLKTSAWPIVYNNTLGAVLAKLAPFTANIKDVELEYKIRQELNKVERFL